MEYRPLGATGLMVSALGYGASPLGHVFGRIDEDEGIRTVRTALDLGVNLIDVSPYYGMTVAETVLGKALRTVPWSSYVLASKVGRYGVDEFDFSALCAARGVPLEQLALQFAVRPRAFASTNVGSASVTNMTRNIAWATGPLDTELVEEIQALLALVMDMSWPSGRPANNEVRSRHA